MFKHKPLSIFLLIILIVNSLNAQTSFTIVSKKDKVGVFYDKSDDKVVEIAARMLVDDISKITQKYIEINGDVHKYSILAGTIGQSSLIDRLIDDEKIQVSDIVGKWETYKIEVIDKPLSGIDKALVIVGSDRRATAYGLLEVSKMMGVSPWEWWADVTPEVKEEVSISVSSKTYGSPSVKYRGIFLNDEDWGLQPWAALNYETEKGDIGPKTYVKVFELLLRLRANTIWPAMNESTKAFYSSPENKVVADNYAIVVGSSHAEPMLGDINPEWNHKNKGGHRHRTKSKFIKKLFKKRAKEIKDFESIYTLGMRGEQNSPMNLDEDDLESQVKLLEQVITDQREVLEKDSKEEENIPQVFIPYNEALYCYQNGLNLPEDVMLMWADDNYGYIRQLSNLREQERSGGAGIYYHTSYWGKPHDYLWLNSTNPALLWEEMSKAYEFQSRDFWILNCGDIKPHEYNVELFLDMAWDMTKFEKNSDVKQHRKSWAAREFGEQTANDITDVMLKYDELAFQRRPEFMAWSQVQPVTKARETELTQFHYGDEVSQRINAYQTLITAVDSINTKVPDYRKDAFYQLVYYPVVAAASINHKWLYAYKNKFTASQGRSSALHYGEKAFLAYNRIVSETNYYNNVLQGGKWNHMMNMSPRNLPVFSRPSIAVAYPNSHPELGLALEGYEIELNHETINSYADVLPVFNAYTKNKYYVDVYLKDEEVLKWEAKPRENWIHISKKTGELNADQPEERLWVTIDWDKVPQGENKKEALLGNDDQLIPPGFKVNSAIDFVSGDKTYTVGVSVYNPKFEDLKGYKGFVEDKGFVSIKAEHYTRKKEGAEAKWETFEGLGYSGKVAVALPRTSKSQNWISDIVKNSPTLEYDFYTFNHGEANVNIQAIPTHAFFEGSGVKCAISIDDAKPEIIDFQTSGQSDAWKENVLKNATIKSAKQIINKAGKHTLKIWMVDPGVMIDQVLIDLGGWKKSYTFPKETKL